MQNIVLEFQLESKYSNDEALGIMKHQEMPRIMKNQANETKKKLEWEFTCIRNSGHFRYHTIAPCRNISFVVSASLTAKSIMLYLRHRYMHAAIRFYLVAMCNFQRIHKYRMNAKFGTCLCVCAPRK